MRKIRKATLVAAMIGTLSLAGAGVASAADYDNGSDDGGRNCVQGVDQSHNDSSVTVGLINLSDLLNTTSQQNPVHLSCATGEGSGSFSGSSQDGSAASGGLLGGGLLNGLLGGV